MKKGEILTCGVLVSIALFIILGVSQCLDAKYLELPMHWVGIAIFPVLIALLAGGYISKFKGFGIELETALKKPLASLNLAASDALAELPGDEKGSPGYLSSLSMEEKLKIRKLVVRSGKAGYYTESGLNKYLKSLPNLHYLEVLTESNCFIGFLPVSVFRDDSGLASPKLVRGKVRLLLQALAEAEVPDKFQGYLITLSVRNDQSLVEVLKILRAQSSEFAAVVSTDGVYQGVLFASEVEKKIADSVLATSDPA